MFRRGDVGILKFLAINQNYLLIIEVGLIKECFEKSDLNLLFSKGSWGCKAILCELLLGNGI